ncbi:Pre-rRNA-processing protein ESF2 [Wickerhamiella sorbophila]|uniref:Pre-rRNA-processing protein ESF2 n=1 Tax=Wickerhamiella sorbophila TaxID=45607 RepID=A0A2T0FP79_9ASCO|nr:Pre-rRNA-processing protein ESF2 [Wickerhamiella sorbophila]PRT56787.1 Pre-rRNA-processing protein ESF2 [Wickerhamiella sorbophila]
MSKASDLFSLDDEAHYSSDEDVGRTERWQKEEEIEDVDEEEDDQDEEPTDNVTKPLTPEEMQARLRAIRKSGVVYISRIPPYMKPVKLRQILSRFGEVNRIFLAPEDAASHARRVKAGGNRKKKYTEGWAEFVRKSDAKLAAETLNGNQIGGKKGSFYYDDILNVKYLKRFKWTDLTEQFALEAQERHEKMKAEIAQATRENKVFIENVEKKAMIDKIEQKRATPKATNVHRTFDQRKANPQKKPASTAKVLSNIF